MNKSLAKHDDEPIPSGNSWAETRDLHPRDQMLRRHGFVIHSRPSNGPALWVRQGEVYVEQEALALAKLIEREAKKT